MYICIYIYIYLLLYFTYQHHGADFLGRELLCLAFVLHFHHRLVVHAREDPKRPEKCAQIGHKQGAHYCYYYCYTTLLTLLPTLLHKKKGTPVVGVVYRAQEGRALGSWEDRPPAA